jgi:hypothetical protein
MDLADTREERQIPIHSFLVADFAKTPVKPPFSRSTPMAIFVILGAFR